MNSTLIDVSLVNFTTSLNASRLAAQLILTSTDDDDDTMRYTMRKSLDDEHTPGVFEVSVINFYDKDRDLNKKVSIKTSHRRESDCGGTT